MAKEYIERELAISETRKPRLTDAELRRRLACLPAADVVPVKHGRWIKARGSYYTPGGDPVWECDQCGKGKHVYGIEHGTYGRDVADGQWVSCPNCGAIMDKDGDGDV